MCLDDFVRLTPGEFLHVCESYERGCEAAERGDWERLRILASILVQPYTKRKVSPQELLPLPWDKARMEIKPLEEDRAALVRLKERLGKEAYTHQPQPVGEGAFMCVAVKSGKYPCPRGLRAYRGKRP